MGFEMIFLFAIVAIALLIITGTIIAVIVVLRKPTTAVPKKITPTSANSEIDTEDVISELTSSSPGLTPTPSEDIAAYVESQRANLAEFELKDMSSTFKGTTNDGRRQGVILHLTEPDVPLVAFTSQAVSAKNGSINAETFYGKLDIIIAQGKAGVQFNGEPIGILDYSKQRILGPEGKLLGSIDRPLGNNAPGGKYPISFFGQKAVDLNSSINATSTLRWFSGDKSEQMPAFESINASLEDDQTLLVLAALLVEIGFFNLT